MSEPQFDLFAAPPPPAAPAPPPLPDAEVAKVAETVFAALRELPDADARARIREDLDTNLLVEAGAGAGKTSAMVGRMVSLVRTGRAEVEQLAAVTFTRKAAAELRERFQTSLEKALDTTTAPEDAAIRERLDRALRNIDRAFLGTIHAFCARLLRERPLEAGLDPGFRETLGAEEVRLRRRFWQTHLERLSADGDPSLAELAEMGLRPQQLYNLFEQVVAQPDVSFPAEPRARPDAAALRRIVESLLDRAQSLLPAEEPTGGWDAFQATVRRLRFHRFVLHWQRDSRFLDAIGALTENSFKLVQKRWDDGKAAKSLAEDFAALFAEGGEADRVLRAWWAYRYPIALAFATRAAGAYEHDRLRAGTLNFQDLLQFAARLLRESPSARRELGERYRYLLVDEFQDTDPVQAEVIFLLGSEPDTGDTWRDVVPRPGALFVVGDPKQSIYRFRRADMTLYAQVKQRFERFGAVVELVANFRSGVPVERFVNENFVARFPAEGSETQARYAPMHVQRRDPLPGEGVYWYELDDPVNARVDALAEQDAGRVAAWIAARIEAGEREAGDFLVLTPTTRRLAEYAAALEQRNVPVQVTGAGVGEAMHLRELRLLLRALADPGDPTLTVAVLVGLFFGLDYEQLTQHVERWSPEGGERVRDPFSFTHAWEDADDDVTRALATLHRFWRWTREEPADLAVERMVDAIGLVPLAAAGELGQTRAGAVLFALDAIRAAALAGDASVAGALAALDAALDEDESEAPLEPGRTDVVRVMNLHKAKGLESKVVVLAHPMGDWRPDPLCRIERDERGVAVGYTRVHERRGMREPPLTLAQPLEWDVHEARERAFDAAERDRLLYVAATRAGEELVVGAAYNRNSPSPWRSFYGWLDTGAQRITLPQPERAARHPLERSAEEIRAAVEATSASRTAAGVQGYRAAPVTVRKLEVAADASMESAPAGDGATLADRHERGTEWGTIVHEALEAALRGADGERLALLCRGWLLAAERPTDPDGSPLELAELLGIVAAVRASDLWQRALASPLRLSEAPFAVPFDAAEYRALVGGDAAAAPLEIVDGRIDLAFREDPGWVIVDYKSDGAGAGIPPELLRRYAAQVRLYAGIWERITGEPVREKVLLFTADGAVVPV